MQIGSNPTRIDTLRLSLYEAVAGDAVDLIQDRMCPDLEDYGAAVASALAFARAEGMQMMAQLLQPHEDFDRILENALEKIINGAGHRELLALAGIAIAGGHHG